MKLRVLALDYDGTIAEHGRLASAVRVAIGAARERGLRVVLVTGRILDDLRMLVGDLAVFDAVVAENGAVLAFPKVGRSIALAAPPARPLLDRLRERNVEARAGTCVVELDAGDAHAVLRAIQELRLPLSLLFNAGRVMVLPQAVSKATGMREALRMMRLSPHDVLGIGDAENDHELLAACEVGVAVGWGSPELQRAADLVLPGQGPPAVADYVQRLVAGGLQAPPAPRRELVLGRDTDCALVKLAIKGQNVLVAGDPVSGKSWVTGLLCEQLIAQQYSVCLLDPEGDYAELETLSGVQLLGGEEPPPTMEHLARALRHPDVSVVVDLTRLELPEKHDYVLAALRMLRDLRRDTGLPHRIVVDEAHYFLHDPAETAVLDLAAGGHMLVTWRISGLDAAILATMECVIVTRESDPDEARLLQETFRGGTEPEHWERQLGTLELDEAALLAAGKGVSGTLRRFRLAPRLTRHVRHRQKYLDVPVEPARAFRVEFEGGQPGPQLRTLQQVVDLATSTPGMRIAAHVHRGDFSRWIDDVCHDHVLAATVRELEGRYRAGSLPDFNCALVQAIRSRYRVVDDLAW